MYLKQIASAIWPFARKYMEGTENHDLWFFAQKTIKQEPEGLDKKHNDIDAISETLLGDNDDDF